MERKTPPKYAHVVDLTTQNAIINPGRPTIVIIIVPIILGFCSAPLPLTIYLISGIASPATLAGIQFNIGGALDNAIKLVKDGLYDG